MNVQVDSNVKDFLEIALMSPGNWRPWTPSKAQSQPKTALGEESMLKEITQRRLLQ